ncbi:hypothetical protein ACFVVM_04820 [Nocardia sp. NPDC058176]|uniref:hypothetical protein n=1 Tax=Nocardia sp. NPDC058176 TaxID=3346368 RepID=UPI0036D75D4B
MDSNDKDGPAAASGVNIAAHARQLLRALPIALVVAVLVGAGVWLVRDGGERTYEASLTAQISQQSIGAVFNELTQPYIVMITQDRVLSDVVKNGLAPSEADLRPRVSAMTGPAPSLLIIKAQSDSPEHAERLALAVQQSLDRTASQMRAEAIARSTADLEVHRRVVEDTFTERLADDPLRPELSFDARDVAREIEFRQVLGMARLTVIGSPKAQLVAPHPVQEGLFAALAALIIVAEAIVLVRGAIGRRSGGTPDSTEPTTPDAATERAAQSPTEVESGPPVASAAETVPAPAAKPPAAAPAPPAPKRVSTAKATTPRAAPVPRAGPVPKTGGGDTTAAAKPSAAYDPETTVLPRQSWPVRADPVPPAGGSRNG